MKRLAPTLTLLLLLIGCSTSEPLAVRYNNTSNTTTYTTRGIDLGTLFEGYGIDSGMSVDLQAWATCQGKDCTPRQVWLSFEAANPRSNIQIGNSAVTMSTGAQRYTWNERRGKRAEQDVTYVRGEFVRVAVTLDELREIATAESTVDGSVGPETFSLSYEERAPLRKLVDRISS